MKYRALAYDRAAGRHYYEYGLPAYGFGTTEMTQIGTMDGNFVSVDPDTWGRATGYEDVTGRSIYTGDIVELKVGGVIHRLEVVETTLDRVVEALPGYPTVDARLQGVIAFKLGGQDYHLIPCIDGQGKCDTEKMKIVGDIHTKAEEDRIARMLKNFRRASKIHA